MQRGRKFVYYRNKKTGRLDEMNFWEWELIQKNPYRKIDFEFIKIVDLDNPETPKSTETGETPIIEDELECPLCGFVGKNKKSLQMHKNKKHG